jgi:hypothetical protein
MTTVTITVDSRGLLPTVTFGKTKGRFAAWTADTAKPIKKTGKRKSKSRKSKSKR